MKYLYVPEPNLILAEQTDGGTPEVKDQYWVINGHWYGRLFDGNLFGVDDRCYDEAPNWRCPCVVFECDHQPNWEEALAVWEQHIGSHKSYDDAMKGLF